MREDAVTTHACAARTRATGSEAVMATAETVVETTA